jgi:hypothetical protein
MIVSTADISSVFGGTNKICCAWRQYVRQFLLSYTKTGRIQQKKIIIRIL